MASKTQEAKDAQGYTKKPQQCNKLRELQERDGAHAGKP
jgi:hypothetical protein